MLTARRCVVPGRPATRTPARSALNTAQLVSHVRRAPSRPMGNPVRRSFATEKPAAKPAGKPAAAPAAGGKAAAGGPPDEFADIPKPPPPPPPKTPHDPTNPLHAKHPGIPIYPPGTIPEHIAKIAEAISRLNMLEAAQLNVLLQQQLGITEEQIKGWFGSMSGGVVYAAPPPGAGGAGAPAAGGAGGAPAKEEKKEKTAFNLKLVKIEESQKIKILKEIRVLRPGMNLAETKALTDKLPSLLKESVPKEEAETWVKKLKEVGATVELE